MLYRIFKSIFITIAMSFLFAFVVLFAVPSLYQQSTLVENVEDVLSEVLRNKVKSGHVSFSIVPNASITFKRLEIGEGEKLVIENVKIYADGLSLFLGDIEGSFEADLEGTKIRGRINIYGYSGIISGQKTKVAISFNNPIKISLFGDVTSSRKYLGLTNFVVATDNSKGKFSVELDNFPHDIAIVADIEFEQLDIKEVTDIASIISYVVSKGKGVQQDQDADIPEESSEFSWNTKQYNLSILNHDVDIKADIKKLVYEKYEAGKINILVKGLKNQWKTVTSSESFYGGSANASAEHSVVDGVLSVKKDFTFTDVRLGDFLRQNTKLKRLQGSANLKGSFTAQGLSEKDMISSLSGNLDASMQNGTILGVDFNALADSSEKNVDRVMEGKGNDTEILAFSSKYLVENGIVNVEEFDVAMPFGQKLSGEGTIDLPEFTIDARIVPALKAGGIGLRFPLKMRGALDNPKYSIDHISAIIENADQLGITKLKPIKVIVDQFKNLEGGIEDAGKAAIKALLSPIFGGKKENTEEENTQEK